MCTTQQWHTSPVYTAARERERERKRERERERECTHECISLRNGMQYPYTKLRERGRERERQKASKCECLSFSNGAREREGEGGKRERVKECA